MLRRFLMGPTVDGCYSSELLYNTDTLYEIDIQYVI
jgi:hypothetical protein